MHGHTNIKHMPSWPNRYWSSRNKMSRMWSADIYSLLLLQLGHISLEMIPMFHSHCRTFSSVHKLMVICFYCICLRQLWIFHSMANFVTVRSCHHLAQPPSWRTTPCRLSPTAYSIYSLLPSILQAVPLSATWRRAMPWWHGPHLSRTAEDYVMRPYDLHCSWNIRMIRSRRMRWEGLVAWMEEGRCTSTVLEGKHEKKRPLAKPRHRCESNIKADLSRHVMGTWTGSL